MATLHCPFCGNAFDDLGLAGQSVACPHCAVLVALPPAEVVEAVVVRSASATPSRKTFSIRSLAIVIAIFGAGLACAVLLVSLLNSPHGSISPLTALVLGDPDKQAVRRHLRHNLDDPEFEEVEWRKGWSHFAGAAQDYHKPGQIWVGLKYRARNRFGASVISEAQFFVVDGEVVNVLENVPINLMTTLPDDSHH